jgi:hypothetical protein
MFHVFQARRHPKWGGNEVEQLIYPSEDAEVLAERRLESTALRRALAAGKPGEAGAWAARALAARQERFTHLSDGAAAYERGTEVKEGLARYVEALAAGDEGSLLPEAEFPPESVRLRSYDSGAAIALLLDRLDPAWKRRLEEKDETPLDELLRRAVAGTELMAFTDIEEEGAPPGDEDVKAMSAAAPRSVRTFSEPPAGPSSSKPGLRSFPRGSIRGMSSACPGRKSFTRAGSSSATPRALSRSSTAVA